MARKFNKVAKWECDYKRNHDKRAPHPYGGAEGTPSLVTLECRERCRECGQHMQPGEQAVTWLHNFSEFTYWRQYVYIHVHNCVPWTVRDALLTPQTYGLSSEQFSRVLAILDVDTTKGLDATFDVREMKKAIATVTAMTA